MTMAADWGRALSLPHFSCSQLFIVVHYLWYTTRDRKGLVVVEQERKELAVGMEVFLEPQGYRTRYNPTIERHYVKRVGRKYFETWDGEHEGSIIKFHIDTRRQVTEYIPSWALYLTEQEIVEKRERDRLLSYVRIKVHENVSKLSLDQLKRIESVLLELDVQDS